MLLSRSAALRALGTGFVANALVSEAGAQTLVPVRIGGAVDEGLTPVLYALSNDLFKRAGLDVTLSSSQNGAALASAIVGGSFTFAKGGLMAMIAAHVRGLPLKIIAPAVLFAGAPTLQLIAWKSGGIKSLADVNGKVAAVATLQSIDQLGTQAMIDADGGDSSSVHFIEMPYAAMQNALEAGRVAIASISVPTLLKVLESGQVHSFGNPYEAVAKRFLIGVWFCNADFANSNPAVVSRFVSVLHDAAVYTNAHHAETLQLIANYTGISLDTLRDMHRDVIGMDLNPRVIQPAIDAAYKYKYIAQTFDARELLLS